MCNSMKFWTFLLFHFLSLFTSILTADYGDWSLHKNYKLIYNGENCGYSYSNRIFGGKEANLGQFPWMAMIGYLNEQENKISYYSGGSIISNLYILTAAHVYNETEKEIPVKVKLGEHNTDTDPDCVLGVCAPPVQVIDIQEIVPNVNFKQTTDPYDICLIRLIERIQFNDFVGPICLPLQSAYQNTMTDELAEVAGWGAYDRGGEFSKVLQTLWVKIWSNAECKDSYSYHLKLNIKDGQMCAGGMEGKDTCLGDSGGPLMKSTIINGQPRYILIGIVSFGFECGRRDYPGIYIVVSKFIGWILDHVKP